MALTTPITLLYASILALIFVMLVFLVIKMRYGLSVAYGDGKNPELRSRIRAHANFAEYIPFLLLFMLLGEINHQPDAILHAFGCILVISRVAHVYSLTVAEHQEKRSFIFRMLATALTMILFIVSAVYGLYLSIF